MNEPRLDKEKARRLVDRAGRLVALTVYVYWLFKT
jgi:hypothetical protein